MASIATCNKLPECNPINRCIPSGKLAKIIIFSSYINYKLPCSIAMLDYQSVSWHGNQTWLDPYKVRLWDPGPFFATKSWWLVPWKTSNTLDIAEDCYLCILMDHLSPGHHTSIHQNSNFVVSPHIINHLGFSKASYCWLNKIIIFPLMW